MVRDRSPNPRYAGSSPAANYKKGIMKYLFVFLLVIFLTGCTDHRKVMKEYESGNKNAADLLLHGFNMKNSEYISTYLINKSLAGDEEAKQIIYAQIESLRGLPSNHAQVVTTPVIIHSSGRR